MCLKREKDCFLKTNQKNWVWFVTLQVPSDCWNVLSKKESEKQNFTGFCTSPPKKTMSRENVQKTKETPFLDITPESDQKKRKTSDIDQVEAYISNKLQLQNYLQLFTTKINHFFQLPAFYLGHAWLTTLLLRWTSQFYRLCGLWKMPRQIWTRFCFKMVPTTLMET